MGTAVGEPSHGDACLVMLPEEVFVGNAVDVRLLGRVLRDTTSHLADEQGRELHHAQWTLSADPEVIRTRNGYPSEDGCARCVAGMDQALAYVADTGHPVGIGHLYWV